MQRKPPISPTFANATPPVRISLRHLEWEPATYSRRADRDPPLGFAPPVAPLGAPSVYTPLGGLSGNDAIELGLGHRAGELGGDPAVGVDHIGLREGVREPVVLGDGLAPRREDGPGHIVGGDEAAGVGVRVSVEHRDDLDLARRVDGDERPESRRFLLAPLAPCGEEVEDDPSAPIRRRRQPDPAERAPGPRRRDRTRLEGLEGR
jgi:hypothetical protein